MTKGTRQKQVLRAPFLKEFIWTIDSNAKSNVVHTRSTTKSRLR